MSLQELIDVFSLEGINRSNAVVNFKEPADNSRRNVRPESSVAECRAHSCLPVEELSARLLPIVHAAGFNISPEKMLRIDATDS